MNIRLSVLPFVVCIANFAAEEPLLAQEKSGAEFRSLFNAMNLDGWVPVNTAPSTWTVSDGLLVCSGKPIGEIRTERMVQNFILELEWRHMKPRGNAGVFIWADDITARGQPFHRGIEVQVLENAYGDSQSHTTHGDIFPIHGATMVPVNGRGGSRAFPTESRSKPSPEWNHYRIECRDGDISLAVNGKVVTQGKQCVPRKGYICLESEGGIVHYRNIRIQELPDTPVDPLHVAIANRGFTSLYNGLDLTGWKSAAGAHQAWQASDWVLKYSEQESPQNTSISTNDSFGDIGFIIDVRFGRSPKKVKIAFRDAKPGAITLDPESSDLKPLLEKQGQWNRIEATIQGHRLSTSVNGKAWLTDLELTGLPARGPIRIEPYGPTDFANIYIRHLEK